MKKIDCSGIKQNKKNKNITHLECLIGLTLHCPEKNK